MSYFAFLAEHGTTLLLGTVTTIKVLVCSMILYVIISMIFGLMRLSKNLVIQGIATVYIEFFRGTSLLVQLFWVYYVLPFFGISLEAFVAGVVALGLNFGAYGAEIVRGGILAVPKGQWEAAHALNFSPTKRIKRIIISQIFPIILPPAANLTVELLKATALVAICTCAFFKMVRSFSCKKSWKREGLILWKWVLDGILLMKFCHKCYGQL